RRFGSRLPRAGQGDSGRPLRNPGRGRVGDRLPRVRCGGVRHRAGDRGRWRLVSLFVVVTGARPADRSRLDGHGRGGRRGRTATGGGGGGGGVVAPPTPVGGGGDVGLAEGGGMVGAAGELAAHR